MILTGENWSAGRKKLYRVGGRWMNMYGAKLEWYWQRKTEVLGEKHYTAWVVDGWMILTGENWSTGRKTLYSVGGRWMNDTDRGNWSTGRKTLYSVGGRWMNDTDRGKWITGRKTLYSVGGRWMDEYGAMVEWYWQGKLKYWEKNIIQCGR